MTHDLPDHPDRITAGWLTAALRTSGALRSGGVASVRSEVIGAERGFTGVIARLKVGYDGVDTGEDPPNSLVAKFPMADRDVESTYSVSRRNSDALRAHFDRSVRELRFYREVAPVAGVPAPRFYAGESDAETMSVAMVMQDVITSGWGDPLTGCTPDQAAQVVNAVAPLHAWAWGQPKPDWMPQPQAEYEASAERYAGYVGPFLAQWGDQLPDIVHDIARRLAPRLSWVLAELDAAPATVIHGDLHLDNILFTPRSEGPAVILDWQGVRRGPVALDVAAFVFGSLAPGHRRAYAGPIFERYLARLAAHGVAGATVEQLERDARLVLLRRVAGIVNWAVQAESAAISPRERALIEAELSNDRLVSALIDYDVAGLLG